jgi:hypothetical protein
LAGPSLLSIIFIHVKGVKTAKGNSAFGNVLNPSRGRRVL